jgi:diguanylate cyclase (GGDEF)-like protein
VSAVSTSVRARASDHDGPHVPSAAAQASRLLAACAAGALATVLAGGGQGCWLALPLALAVVAFAPRTAVAAPAAGVVVLAGLLPAVALPALTPPSDPALGLPIAAASGVVVLALRRRAELERRGLRASALSDPLTGVANRRALLERVDYEIARHARLRRSFAVLALDLDGFKALNDRFGHPAGDELLCDVAAALRHAVREQDTVARTGGDEFCVLAPETDASGAQRLVTRVEAAVARVTAGLDTLSASVGRAHYPHDGASAAAVLKAADGDLLLRKRSRPGRARRRAA